MAALLERSRPSSDPPSLLAAVVRGGAVGSGFADPPRSRSARLVAEHSRRAAVSRQCRPVVSGCALFALGLIKTPWCRFAFAMKVHLVDGTYELFRHFFGAPPHRNAAGQEVAAVGGGGLRPPTLGGGATHVGVATDHVIESFRNDLWPGYKTGAGVDPDLWSQAWPLEEALAALGCSCGRWSTLRRTTRWPAGPRSPVTTPSLTRSSSARRTRTSANVFAAAISFSSIGARTCSSTRTGSWPSSGWVRPPSLTTSPWSGTAPTGFPDWRDGGPSLRPPSWPGGGIWRTFLTTRPSGRSTSGAAKLARCAGREPGRRTVVQGAGHPAGGPLPARAGRGPALAGPHE